MKQTEDFQINQFNEYSYPPDLEKCNKHRLAHRIFKFNKDQNVDMFTEKCECCNQLIGEQKIDRNCCYSSKQLAFLGLGVPLYFLYLKNAILVLFLMFLTFGCYGMYTNYNSDYCLQLDCKSFFDLVSIVNKLDKNELLLGQNYGLFGFILMVFVFFLHFKYQCESLKLKCDESINSPSDYAIILRRLPPLITINKIENMIYQKKNQITHEDKIKTVDLKIDQIILSYSLTQFNKKKEQNLNNFKKCIEEGRKDQFSQQQVKSPSETGNIAIVIFRKQITKAFFIYKPKFSQKLKQVFMSPLVPLSPYKIDGKNIAIQRAPQPQDIIWQNADYSLKQQIRKKIKYTLISFGILILGMGCQIGIQILRLNISDYSFQTILSYTSSTIISIFNYIILQFLIFASKKQRCLTKTQYYTTLMIKISLLQFLNAGLFLVFSKIIVNASALDLSKGLAQQITIFMIMNAIFPNLITFIMCYFEPLEKFKRYLIKSNKVIKTQKEANHIFQGPEAEIADKYAYIIKTIWLTAFYGSFVPITVIISLFGFILNYIVQKILYTSVYSSKSSLSDVLNNEALKLLELTPFFATLGSLLLQIYESSITNHLLTMEWILIITVSLILGLLHFLIPQHIFRKIYQLNEIKIDDQDYYDIEKTFTKTYSNANPAYRDKMKSKKDDDPEFYEYLQRIKQEKLKKKQQIEMIEINHWKKAAYHPLLDKSKQVKNLVQMNKLNKTNYPKTDNMRYEMGQAFSKLIEKNISKELALNHSDHHILNERYDQI